MSALAVLITGCSSGGPPDSNGSGVAKPDLGAECREIQAIEGGGRRHKLSGVLASVSTDGELSVNDIRINTTDADVLVDGTTATTAGLKTGDVVTLAGSFDFAERQGCASAVLSDADLAATVDSVDTTSRSLVVLGQKVQVTDDTALGEGAELSSLQVGDRVRVSGLQATGSILASRIDRSQGEGYFVTGAVRAADALQQTFVLNELTVRYDGASLDGFDGGAPREGDFVRVTGSATEVSGPTVLRPDVVTRIDYGTALEIFPTTASLPIGGSIQFLVTRADGAVKWRLTRTDGGACSANSACGTIDAGGRYTAPQNDASAKRVLVTARSIADPRIEATAAVYIAGAGGFPTSGPHTLDGEVFAAGVGALPEASVSIYVGLGNGGYSYWWANGPLSSDASGRFTAPNLPDSNAAVFAMTFGYMQPCAVTANVRSDTQVRVELVPTSTFDALDAPLPQLAVEPSVSGQIYEMGATGRQRITGAVVWLEETLGIPYAITLSDGDGSYYVCNVDDLPTLAWLTVVKDGYETVSVGPVNGPDSRTLDVELKRLP